MDFGNDSRPMYRSFTDPMSYSLASCTGSATFQPLTFDAFPSFSAPAPETPPPRPSPPPPDTLARVSMRKKISELDHEDALDVLSALVERSPEAFRPVKDMLFPRKRARDAQLECESCAEMFCLEDEPGETTCRYHDGELHIDEGLDIWRENEFPFEMILPTRENEERFPSGFYWTCCTALGDTVGCKAGHKHAERRQNQRPRLTRWKDCCRAV